MARWMEALAEKLDLPAEALAGVFRVTVTGKERILIENHRGVLAYTDTEVEVGGGTARLRIRGERLLLRAMNREMLLITGVIYSMDYL